MNSIKEKILKLEEILAGSWISCEFEDKKAKIKGIEKSSVIEINLSEIDKLAILLDHSNLKVRYETIKILSLFGEAANPYVGNFVKNFFDYDWKQQRDILVSLSEIKTEIVLDTYSELLDKMKEPIHGIYRLIFFVSEYLEHYPVKGLEIISKIAKFETIWKIYQETIQEVLAFEALPDDYYKKLEEERLRPPPIGMSQEQEMRRLEHNLTKMHIQNTIKTLLEQEKNNDKQAKQVLRLLRRKIK